MKILSTNCKKVIERSLTDIYSIKNFEVDKNDIITFISVGPFDDNDLEAIENVVKDCLDINSIKYSEVEAEQDYWGYGKNYVTIRIFN